MNETKDNEILTERAQAYRVLASQPGWKLLLDHLANQSDRLLGVIRSQPLGSRETTADLVIEWRAVEKVMDWMQNQVLGTIEDHERLVKEILAQHYPEEQVEKLVSQIQTTGV